MIRAEDLLADLRDGLPGMDGLVDFVQIVVPASALLDQIGQSVVGASPNFPGCGEGVVECRERFLRLMLAPEFACFVHLRLSRSALRPLDRVQMGAAPFACEHDARTARLPRLRAATFCQLMHQRLARRDRVFVIAVVFMMLSLPRQLAKSASPGKVIQGGWNFGHFHGSVSGGHDLVIECRVGGPFLDTSRATHNP